MEHIVRSVDAGKDILVTGEIASDYCHSRIAQVLCKHLAVLLAVSGKNTDSEAVLTLI